MDTNERPGGATILDPHAAGEAENSARAPWQPSPWVLERRDVGATGRPNPTAVISQRIRCQPVAEVPRDDLRLGAVGS